MGLTMTYNDFVTLDTVEQNLGQIPGMTELIEAEYAAIRAAEFVKQTRKAAHLSQAALAERVGVAPARISEVEAGRGNYGPSVAFLARVAEACGGTLQLSVKAGVVRNP